MNAVVGNTSGKVILNFSVVNGKSRHSFVIIVYKHKSHKLHDTGLTVSTRVQRIDYKLSVALSRIRLIMLIQVITAITNDVSFQLEDCPKRALRIYFIYNKIVCNS